MTADKPTFLDKVSFDSYIIHKDFERQVSMDTNSLIIFNSNQMTVYIQMKEKPY